MAPSANDPLPPEADREVCVCFHVPLRKLVKHWRLNRMRHASQFAQCHGAGTGCGWCVPFLEKIYEQLEAGEPPRMAMTVEEYKARRLDYHKTKKPDLPPPPDAEAPLALDLEDVLDQVPDDLKLD